MLDGNITKTKTTTLNVIEHTDGPSEVQTTKRMSTEVKSKSPYIL